jgi:hypothetical protein
MEAIPQLIEFAASGKLSIETEITRLCEIEEAWQRRSSDKRRLVFVP